MKIFKLLVIYINIFIILCINNIKSVDKSKFRTCSLTKFCKNYRQNPFPEIISEKDMISNVHSSTDKQLSTTKVIHIDEIEINPNLGSIRFLLDIPNKYNLPFIGNGIISFLQSGAIRFNVTESNVNRWTPSDILHSDGILPGSFTKLDRNEIKEINPKIDLNTNNIIGFQSNSNKKCILLLYIIPYFQIEIYINKELTISVNKHNFFHYEPHQRKKQNNINHNSTNIIEMNIDIHGGKKIIDYGEDGLAIYEDGTKQKSENTNLNLNNNNDNDNNNDHTNWEESFGSHIDSMPNGPVSIGIDINFHSTNEKTNVFGIPEHASDFSLKDTKHIPNSSSNKDRYNEPYRLYNLDVFEYELDEPMALYGSIPVLIGHNSKHTNGIYYNNPTETFIDIQSITYDKVTNDQTFIKNEKITHWLSESGILDIFFLLQNENQSISISNEKYKNKNEIMDIFNQYNKLTGYQTLPPIFSLGYHQCRWNYKDEKDVMYVNNNFNKYNIPYDVLWLDIEHTDSKTYFTWDDTLFPEPLKMIQSIKEQNGRRMVTIIDPHIKVTNDYFVHNLATEYNKDNIKSVYVKNKDGETDFVGWCWPGSSSYVDFTNYDIRKWWAELFHYDTYKHSNIDLYTWNDMNEPSVFNGPEVSMQKDLKNTFGIEHREWHNLYGMYMHQATGMGQIERQKHALSSTSDLTNIKRSFVLSRSFFAGSQQYGAIWTGDNLASFDHLKYSIKMLLSMNIVSLSFVGADVGGFFGNPPTESLMIRWYQCGAFTPFFRGHAHHDTKRREPYLFSDNTNRIIRNAIKERYTYLHYLYTLFFQAYSTGSPVMRPLWLEFPKDTNTFDIENSFMLGDSLLIKPVVTDETFTVDVYLPTDENNDEKDTTIKDKTIWYNVHDSYKKYIGGEEYKNMNSPIDYIPVFQKGGTILFKKERLRKSSLLMKYDPFTLIITLDNNNNANGKIYLDDEETYNSTCFSYREYNYEYNRNDKKAILSSSNLMKDNKNDYIYNNKISYLNEYTNIENTIERIVIVGLKDNLIPKQMILSYPGVSTIIIQDTEIGFIYNKEDNILTLRKPDTKILDDSWIITIDF